MVTRLFYNILRMKNLLIIIALIFVSVNIFAQDIITKQNGEEIQAKVLNVNDKEINYIKWSNMNGPTYTISVNDVFMIKYENGEKDMFEKKGTKENNLSQPQTVIDNKSFSTQMANSNIDFLKRQDLLKRAKSCHRWGQGLFWTILIGGTVGGALCGVTEWNSGAAIGYFLGVGTLSVLPWAILSAKGNKLEEEAYKINVASVPFGRIELDGFSIEPHADLLSFNNDRTFGLGAKISF